MSMPPVAAAQRLKSERYKIGDLLHLVTAGRMRIPKFQRPLRWTAADVCLLFDSIYRGFPIGVLLLWERPADSDRYHLGPVEIEADAHDRAYWVVDGQQRVTALAATLLPAEPGRIDPTFDVSFDLKSLQFHKTRPRQPEHVIPIREAYGHQKVLRWVTEHSIAPELSDVAFELTDRLLSYEIPASHVVADDPMVLQTIFDRTNTSGKKMRKHEVFSAFSLRPGEDRSDIARLEDDITALGRGSFEGNTLTFCVLATRGPDPTREFRGEFDGEAEQSAAMAATRTAVHRMAQFLDADADVPHFSLIPYQFLTVALVRFFATFPEPEDNSLVQLRRWFWRAAESGALARHGSTGTLRKVGACIDSSHGEFGSIKRLMQLFDVPPEPIELGTYRWTSSATRIAVCALAALHPIDPVSGEPVDVTGAIEELGREALAPIVANGPNNVANRYFASVDHGGLVDAELAATEGLRQPHLAASLGLDSAMVQALGDGEFDHFFELRAKAVEDLVQAFLTNRTERDQRPRPSIKSIIDDQ